MPKGEQALPVKSEDALSVIRKRCCFSRATSWMARPAADELPPMMTSTFSSSSHCRAIAEAISGLFCVLALITSTGMPSTVPPTSSTASLVPTTEPSPTTSA